MNVSSINACRFRDRSSRFVPISETLSVVASDLLHDTGSVCDIFQTVLSEGKLS